MYYPLSQITSNLYTNGNEYSIKDTNSPYVGFYWKTSSGTLYTGKNPQDSPVQELIPFNIEGGATNNINSVDSYYNQYEDIVINYLNIKTPTSSPSLPPTYSPTLPTTQDYQIGEFRRYFCKKTNEIIYLEINKDTYDKLIDKDSTILYQLYQPFNLPWQLTGDREQVFKTNKNITELVSNKLNLPMLSAYLKMDFTKYYK